MSHPWLHLARLQCVSFKKTLEYSDECSYSFNITEWSLPSPLSVVGASQTWDAEFTSLALNQPWFPATCPKLWIGDTSPLINFVLVSSFGITVYWCSWSWPCFTKYSRCASWLVVWTLWRIDLRGLTSSWAASVDLAWQCLSPFLFLVSVFRDRCEKHYSFFN